MHSNWQQSQQFWHPSQHSNSLEHRVTRLEVGQERSEEKTDQISDRIRWLERSLQAIAAILLILITRSAPSSAQAAADLLLAIIKR